MNIKTIYNKISLGMIFLSGIFLTGLTYGCTDDLTIENPAENPDTEIEGDCLKFTLRLDRDLSSRAGGYDFSSIDADIEKYENYIDTQDKFRVFFFTADGDFLFGATDRVVGSTNNQDNSGLYWYVRIPMTMLVDREDQEYDIEKIKTYLKTKPFKIAVLANWPNAGAKINPADWDDSESTNSSNENPSSTLKGHPQWNWSNSILNDKAKPEDIRNINDLHHVYNDVYYGDAEREKVYGNFGAHVTTGEAGFYMGEPTDWVKMRDINEGWHNTYALNTAVGSFDSRRTANQWIRANCTPDVEINSTKAIYRHYQHMWFLWNFDASFKYGKWLEEAEKSGSTSMEDKKAKAKEYYGKNFNWNDNSPVELEETNPWGMQWYERNGYELYDWMKKSYNGGNTAQAIGEKFINIGENNNDVFFNYIPASGKYAYCRKVGDYYGIQLPAIGTTERNNYTGMIKFQARTSGTLRIKWGSYEGAASSLTVKVGNTTLPAHSGVTDGTPIDWIANTGSGATAYYDINIDAGSEPVYIYSTQGKAVVYSIEFIRGKYLYETDREGIAPNPDQGIPMYGVKDCDPIPEWQRGTTYTLPDNLSLIRALAKVEVYISSDFGRPRHVYMRAMNRAARCEPMDVFSETDNIWKDPHYNTDLEDDDPEQCEFFRIQKYGPSYGVEDSNYSNWLSWFYTSWQDPDLKWKASGGYQWNYDLKYYAPANGNYTGWKPELTFGNGEQMAPPRIFNPYIYWSDFCRFLYAGESDGYHRYILYLPEKNIDDPSTAGKTATVPRVPHIEYRFDPPVYDEEAQGALDDPYSNTEYNLDDNDCYRIYFTNYGFSSDAVEATHTPVNNELHDKNWNMSTYDNYILDRERLKAHWPIMRNHKYQFYVGGEGPQNPEIHVRVADWGHRKVVVEW